jgi:paraquat-inducible protein B
MTEPRDLPEAVVAPRKHWSVQLVWIIPIVAAIIGGWLAVKAITDRGPTIKITFRSADGLEAGKTKIKYKEVEIGHVTEIALAEDRRNVIVTAQVTKQAESFLVEDTRFWVVRPRIAGGQVTGLGTLLSGSYIGVDIGDSEAPRRNFTALEEPPIVTGDLPGRQFVLRANDLGSIEVGVPVYFRRTQVGEVVAAGLDKDGGGVSFRIFIHAPYDQYVTQNTRFWNASGIDVSLDATGLSVKTQSLVSILIGGVAFEAPPDAGIAPAADANAVFTLFQTRDLAMKTPDREIEPYVIVFQHSVRGLAVGAPVDFRGVTIGEVSRIGLEYDSAAVKFVQPVEIRVYPERLLARFRDSKAERVAGDVAVLRQLVDHGLRAQLRPANLLTGQLYVAVDFFPGAKKVAFDASKTPLEIPTIPGAFDELQTQLASIAKKLDQLPLGEIAGDVRRALAALDRTLKEAETLVKRIDTEVASEARRTLEEARRTFATTEQTLSAQSPLQTDLRETLHELARAAQSLRVLTDALERNPQSLIWGRPAEASP